MSNDEMADRLIDAVSGESPFDAIIALVSVLSVVTQKYVKTEVTEDVSEEIGHALMRCIGSFTSDQEAPCASPQ